MKKTLCLILALAMIVTLAAACGSTTNSGGTDAKQGDNSGASVSGSEKAVKISAFTWGFPPEKKAREEQAKKFNETHKNIQVDLQVSPDYDRKLEAMISANNGPDVYETSNDWYHIHTIKKRLEDLRPYIEKDQFDLSQYFDSAVAGYKLDDGTIEALPLCYDLFVMAYNKDLFDAKGVAYPTGDWTWEDCLAMAQKLTYGEGTEKVYGLSDQWSYQQIAGYLFGGEYMSPDYKEVRANQPLAIKGFQFYVDLYKKYKVMPDADAAKGMGGDQRFFAGKSAMIPCNNWDLDTFITTVGSNFKWDIVKMPTVRDTGKGVAWSIVEGFGMWAGGKNKDAAWEFMKWVTTDPEAQKIGSRAGIPTTKGSEPVFLGLDTSPVQLNIQSYVDSIAIAKPGPFGGIYAELSDEHGRTWDKINSQNMPIQQAFDEFAKNAAEIINRQ